MDGHAIVVRRLPGVPLPRVFPGSAAAAPPARPRHRLHLARRAGRLAFNCLFVAMMLSVLIVLGPALLGFHRYVILTGSMTGTYDRGSIVFDRPTPVSELKVGEPITYSPPRGYTSQQRITHRIWWIGRGAGGERVFMTKGDANKKPDAWKFTLDQPTQDRVIFHVPEIGYLFMLLSMRLFRVALIGLPALLVGFMMLRALWREAGAEARKAHLAELGWQRIADAQLERPLPELAAPAGSPRPILLHLHLPTTAPMAPGPSRPSSQTPAVLPGLHVRRIAAPRARRGRGHHPAPAGDELRRAAGPAAIGLRVTRLRSPVSGATSLRTRSASAADGDARDQVPR